jgi:hypothetical protein
VRNIDYSARGVMMSVKISVISTSDSLTLPADPALPLAQPAAGDIDKFQAVLTTSQGNEGLLNRLMGGAKQASLEMQQRESEIEQSLHQAQRSLDPVDMLKTSTLLASYGQAMSITVRVINKATQSLDQLSKLQ